MGIILVYFFSPLYIVMPNRNFLRFEIWPTSNNDGDLNGAIICQVKAYVLLRQVSTSRKMYSYPEKN